MFLQKCDLRSTCETFHRPLAPTANIVTAGTGKGIEDCGFRIAEWQEERREPGTGANSRNGGTGDQGPGTGDQDGHRQRRATFSRPACWARVAGHGQRRQRRREPGSTAGRREQGPGTGKATDSGGNRQRPRPSRLFLPPQGGDCSLATGFNPWTAAHAVSSSSFVQAPAGRLNTVQPPLKGAGDKETGVVRRSPSTGWNPWLYPHFRRDGEAASAAFAPRSGA